MKKNACALIFFITSCAQFEALEIVSVSPSNGEYGVSATATVRIEFSAQVNRETIERNFMLKANGTIVAGRHLWESDRTYLFVPHKRFPHGARCVMELPRSIEDIRGNSMEKDFISEFYIGSDHLPPQVLYSIPPFTDGGTFGVSRDLSAIEIQFSEPMDTTATSSAFSISPDIAGYFVWNNDNTRLTYCLNARLDIGRQYRVTVSTSAKDAAGNPLAKNYMLIFIAGEDFIHPEVRGAFESGTVPPPYFNTSSINRGISRFSSISVEFSEAMDRTSVENAFSLKPVTAGRFIWSAGNSIVTFIPDKALLMDTVYSLTIATFAKDVSGLALREQFSVLFRTDAPNSLPFKVSSIEGSFDAQTEPFTLLYDGGTLPWPVIIHMGPPDQPNAHDYFIKVHFSNTSKSVPIDISSLIESLHIETIDGGGSPCITDIELVGDGSVAIIAFDGFVNPRKHPYLPPALYRFTIAGGVSGVKDIHGNTMKESFICEFKDSNTP